MFAEPLPKYAVFARGNRPVWGLSKPKRVDFAMFFACKESYFFNPDIERLAVFLPFTPPPWFRPSVWKDKQKALAYFLWSMLGGFLLLVCCCSKFRLQNRQKNQRMGTNMAPIHSSKHQNTVPNQPKAPSIASRNSLLHQNILRGPHFFKGFYSWNLFFLFYLEPKSATTFTPEQNNDQQSSSWRPQCELRV